MKKFNLVSAGVFTALFLSGCSSTHSPEIQKSMDRAQGTFKGGYEEQVKPYRPKRSVIGQVQKGNAYHDVNDYTLVEKDERLLPTTFLNDVSIKEMSGDDSYTVDEFSALIYEAFGVTLDVSSPDLKMLANNPTSKPSMVASSPQEAMQGVTSDSTGNYEQAPRRSSRRDDAPKRDDLKLKNFKYEGTLKGLLDYVSQLNGLKWKYDPDFKRAYLYAFETRTFKLFDLGDEIDTRSSITTASSQSSESTSGGTKNDFRRERKVDTWKEVQTAIDELISEEYGRATFNAKTGVISVRDSDYNLAQVKRYIDEINSATSTEVTVEFKIIRVKFNDGDTHGINQNYLNTKLQNNLLGSFDLEFGAGNLSSNIAGNLGSFQSLMQGNFLSIANESHQFLMGFLNTVGTAEVAYSTQVQVLNNEVYNDQNQETEEYIAEIERSSFGDSNGRENVTTKRDVAVDGVSLSLRPRVVGDQIMVSYALSNSDFIGLKDAGVEGVKLRTQGALNLDNTATLVNGVPKVIKFTHQEDNSTSSQGMFDNMFWFLGGNESRTESKSAIIVTMTAYYNN